MEKYKRCHEHDPHIIPSLARHENSFSCGLARNYKFFVAAVGTIVAVSVFAVIQRPNASMQIAGATGAGTPQIEIAMVGGNAEDAMPEIENSWPGEIISLNNLPVQPPREGTISGWFVRIGQYVSQGEVLGTLSRPPQTPDVVAMLSEKSEDLSRMRTTADAEREFTKNRITQLKQLRADTERLTEEKTGFLGQNDSSLSLVAAKKQLVRAALRGSIIKTFPMMFTQSSIPSSGMFLTITLKPAIGAVNSGLRNGFPEIIARAWADSANGNIVPEQSGLLYFENALKLANASIAGGDMLAEKDLDSLKVMLVADQSMFVAALGEVKDVELESVNVKKESVDALAEIDKELAELQKMLSVSEGEIAAKESAYISVSGAVNGGYSIVAPRSGMVSSIMKKPGDFVSPGMPVAIITGAGKSEELVRMRLPNNIRKPKIGAILSAVRPGFSSDVKKARLVGVGGSLDETGSYMADAAFLEATDWPVGASVRILSSASSTVTVKNSAVLFGEGGKPFVWEVSEAGRVFKRSITVGRIMGEDAEVYEGLKNGDRYVLAPNDTIKEDMLIGDIKDETQSESSYEQAMRDMGM